MNRVTIAALLAILFVESASATPFETFRQVNLNRPGVLENIRTKNPSHYGIIMSVLDGLKQRPDEDVPQWIVTHFQASTASYSPYVLTSFPGQKDLSLTLSGTRYFARITLMPGRALVLPRSQ